MRRLLSCSAVACCALLNSVVSTACRAEDIQLFVSTSGNDSATGTESEPLATLAGAQAKLRELRDQHRSSSAVVWFAEGVYWLNAPVRFTAHDNATEDATTTYAALPGQHPTLRAGVEVKSLVSLTEQQLPADIPTAARPYIKAIDLAMLGIEDVTEHARRSRHVSMQPTSLELFCGDKRLPAAGWPNQGWAHVPMSANGQPAWTIETGLHAIHRPVTAWAHGFWQHDWQDSCEPIALSTQRSGDQAAVRLSVEHEQVSQVRAGARYRIEHLLSELDSPGEWFLDQAHRVIYLWPEPNTLDGLFISTLDTPISIYDAERLTLRGFTIEGARASCVEIAGGHQVTLTGCTIRHAGNLGINLYHGSEHCISHCHITGSGAGGIRAEGGDRAALTHAYHVIEHNRLHDFCQHQWSYRPGINVYGMGITVRNNEIYNAAHSAIILHGNEHTVQNNHIHHVCRDTDDAGAIYIGHNPTFRGNVIEHNYIHDIGGFSKTGVIGIYLDDFASGTTVSHNLIRNCPRGVAIGGGRDNLVDGNLFIDCLAAVQIDQRGKTWAQNMVRGPRSTFSTSRQELADHWSQFIQRYPELAELAEDSPEVPKGNRIHDNIFESPIGIDLQDGLDGSIVIHERNHANARRLLVDVDHNDFRLKQEIPGEPVLQTFDLAAVGPADSEPREILVDK